MSRVYEFWPGLLELGLRVIGIETRDKKMELTRKDLVFKVSDLAKYYGLDPGVCVADFFTREASYLYKHNSYVKNTVRYDSLKFFSIYTRASNIKYGGRLK